MEWTIARAKAELPGVKIKFGGEVINACLSGSGRWATVWFRIRGSIVNVEFAWETIVHSLNTGSTLIA